MSAKIQGQILVLELVLANGLDGTIGILLLGQNVIRKDIVKGRRPPGEFLSVLIHRCLLHPLVGDDGGTIGIDHDQMGNALRPKLGRQLHPHVLGALPRNAQPGHVRGVVLPLVEGLVEGYVQHLKVLAGRLHLLVHGGEHGSEALAGRTPVGREVDGHEPVREGNGGRDGGERLEIVGCVAAAGELDGSENVNDGGHGDRVCNLEQYVLFAGLIWFMTGKISEGKHELEVLQFGK